MLGVGSRDVGFEWIGVFRASFETHSLTVCDVIRRGRLGEQKRKKVIIGIFMVGRFTTWNSVFLGLQFHLSFLFVSLYLDNRAR